MLALPELPQLPSVASVACAVSTWFFIKYEIIFYMKPSPTSPALPCLSHPLTCANAHFSPRLFVALFMGCSSPALFVNFRGWFDALRSTPWPPPPSPPLMRLALIINCITGFACCLLCPGQLVREGSLGCPWGRDAADGVLTERPASAPSLWHPLQMLPVSRAGGA